MLVSAVEMATALPQCNTEEQRCVTRFLWAKELNVKDIHKCFLFTVWSVCRIKRFTAVWKNVATFRWWRRGWNGDVEMAEKRAKRLLWCGFRRTGKAMGQEYQCWWRICREINVSSRFEYRMFYVLHPFVTYLLTLALVFWGTGGVVK
jgi:hypothetical protein